MAKISNKIVSLQFHATAVFPSLSDSDFIAN